MQRYYKEIYMYDSKSVTDFGSKIAKQISAGGRKAPASSQAATQTKPNTKKKEIKLDRRKICI